MKSLAKNFARATAANTALIFGVCLVPVLVAAGVAVDYSERSKVQGELQAVVDAAALAATRESKAVPPPSNEQLKEVAINYAKYNFASKFIFAQNHFPFNVDNLTVTINSASTGGKEIIVDYKDSLPTTMMQLAGIDTMDIHATARSMTSPLLNKLNLFIVLDTSPSMGLPKGDVIPRLTPDGCFFACHDNGAINRDYMSVGGADYEPKMDVVKNGIGDLLMKVKEKVDATDPDNATKPDSEKAVAYYMLYFNAAVKTKFARSFDAEDVRRSLEPPITLSGENEMNEDGTPAPPKAGTLLNLGMDKARDLIEKDHIDRPDEKRRNIIVFVSDGVDHRDPFTDPDTTVAAEYAPPACRDLQQLKASKGIDVEIYTMHIHNSSDSYESAFNASGWVDGTRRATLPIRTEEFPAGDPTQKINPSAKREREDTPGIWGKVFNGGKDPFGYGWMSGVNNGGNVMQKCASDAAHAFDSKFISIEDAFKGLIDSVTSSSPIRLMPDAPITENLPQDHLGPGLLVKKSEIPISPL